MTEDYEVGENENPLHYKGYQLTEDDKVLFNDRARPLTVTGHHPRQNTSSTWRRRGCEKYYKVVELEGNGTVYHLLINRGSSFGPVLYQEADWDEEKTDDLGQSPVYSRSGERVESLEVIRQSDSD